VGSDPPADLADAAQAVAPHLLNAKPHDAVVDQHAVPHEHLVDQLRPIGGNAFSRADHGLAQNIDPVTRADREGVTFDLPHANLRPAQIDDDGHQGLASGGHRADALERPGVLLTRTVREVQPENVRAGSNQGVEDLGRIGSGPDGGDDLGSNHRRCLRPSAVQLDVTLQRS